MSDALTLHDKDLQTEISEFVTAFNIAQQSKNRNTQYSSLDKQLLDLKSKLFAVTHTMQQLYKSNKKYEARITKLEHENTLKYATKDCKEKMRKQKLGLQTQIEELQSNLRQEIGGSEQKISQDVQKFFDALREVERKTIWKIQDCQDLLQKRTNEEFVLDAIRNLEEKLQKDILMIQGGEINLKFQNDLIQLKNLVKLNDDQQLEKYNKLKNQIGDLQEQLQVKHFQIEKINEGARLNNEKLSDMNQKLMSSLMRLDYGQKIESHQKKLEYLEKLIEQFRQEEQKRIESLKELNLNSDNITYLLSKIDPHKICALEGDIKKVEEQCIRNTVYWETLDREFKNKMDSFNYLAQLQQATSPQKPPDEEILKNYLLKDDAAIIISEYIEQFKVDDDKLKKINRDLSEMSYKVENALEVERRVNRIFKDLDINHLIKQIKQKANEEETKKEFLIMENRLNLALESLGILRKDIDSMFQFMKKSGSQTNSAVSPPTDMTLYTKKLYPVSCLSCHVQKEPSQIQRLRGYDGKYYKVDLNKTSENAQQFESDEQQIRQSYQQKISRGIKMIEEDQASLNQIQNALQSKQKLRKRPISAKK